MCRAVDCLILGRKQCFDLIIGSVDGAGAARFVSTLAAERERGFGEGRPFARSMGWWRFGAH
jgi:hypothetical protein